MEYFKEKLTEKESQTWVPSLNDVPLHYLKPNSLVKFRCMIQDMFDPEFYMALYETVDPANNRSLKCGKYKDVTESVQVDFDSKRCVTRERQTFYCVPIPGESPWVKDCYAQSNQARVQPSTSFTPHRHKRSYDEDDNMDTQSGDQMSTQPGSQASGDSQGNGESKRQETEAPPSSRSGPSPPTCPTPLDLNFPLPGEAGPACLVKVYDQWESFKLNDALEVFGILTVDPALSGLAEGRESSSLLDPMETIDNLEEHRAHSPPPSLVPRLHLLYARPLQHNNPLLPSSAEEKSTFLSSFQGEAASTRAELLAFLTHSLLGDQLAAEYLLLHLISNVYARRDVLPLGKFTLNLSGCPHGSPYTQQLYHIIQQLVPAAHQLPMTLANMNAARLVPHKDYTANRLVSGVLQLPSNTSLFLDETQLEQGQLDVTGVRNITALGNLITWQKVDYDFNFHQMEFPCNINVLVASEGRSLLPSDCQVHLQPQVTPDHLEDYMNGLLATQTLSQLNKYRLFLSVARQHDYSISEEVTKAVEDDFVDMRKDDPQSMTAEDLHRMLVVSRLLSVSCGQSSLSMDIWNKAKQMELLRTSRIQLQKTVNGNEP